MAWCCQAPSHYLSQCWPRSMASYGVTRPQWVNSMWSSDAIQSQPSRSTLVQVLACRLFGAKPLPESMLTHWQSSKFQWNLNRNSNIYLKANAFCLLFHNKSLWLIVNWTPGIKHQKNSNRSTTISRHKNEFENAIWKWYTICLGLNVFQSYCPFIFPEPQFLHHSASEHGEVITCPVKYGWNYLSIPKL